MSDDSPTDQYEYTIVPTPTDELDAYIKKVFKLSTSPTDALKDDDWSFVIKMSAYIEVALNELLMAHFNDSRLEKIIEKMNMGSDRQGKLAFTKALELLPAKSWRFIDLLSELRGTIVHRVSMLNLNLSEYLQASQKKEAWKMALVSSEHPEANKTPDAVLIYARWFIFRSVMGVMGQTALKTDRTKLDHEIAAWIREVGEMQVFRSKKETPQESSPNQPGASQP